MTAADTPAEASASPSGSPYSQPAWREPGFLRAWAAAEMWTACMFLVVIFVSVLWQVVSRYVPALNWPGVSELANYSLIVLTFVMVGYLIGKNGHIAIQIIDYVVKGRAFVVVKALSAVCVAVICALLAWEAYALIRAYPTRTTAALGIPVWLLYAVPLAGFTSGVVRAVVRIFTANRQDEIFNPAETT
jgi:TRAP-type C4-dicarboxylate transport system permease small subunit